MYTIPLVSIILNLCGLEKINIKFTFENQILQSINLKIINKMLNNAYHALFKEPFMSTEPNNQPKVHCVTTEAYVQHIAQILTMPVPN